MIITECRALFEMIYFIFGLLSQIKNNFHPKPHFQVKFEETNEHLVLVSITSLFLRGGLFDFLSRNVRFS